MSFAGVMDSLARRVRKAPPRMRKFLMRGPWGKVGAAGILAAMPRRIKPGSTGELDLVVRWEVEGLRPRFLLIREGRARLRRDAERSPDLGLALDRLSLLELAVGAANGPQLFMTGRVQLTGDLMLAQRLTSLFAVPGAVRA